MVYFVSRINLIRNHLKNRILFQGQGGGEFQPAGILKRVEDLKREPNADIGPKDIFEMASNKGLTPLHLPVKTPT